MERLNNYLPYTSDFAVEIAVVTALSTKMNGYFPFFYYYYFLLVLLYCCPFSKREKRNEKHAATEQKKMKENSTGKTNVPIEQIAN